MSETSDEPTDPILLSYKKLFLDHLSHAHRHFYARKPSKTSIESDLSSSLLPPNAFWTSEEKELFFRSLSRHSKLRPDLIAADVGTLFGEEKKGKKTVVDVIAYIALLEEGLKSSSSAFVNDEGTQEDDVDEGGLSHPSARMVSRKWLRFEERQSVKLVGMEMEWEAERVDEERRKMKKQVKKNIGSSRAKGLSRSKALDREYRQRFEEEVEKMEKCWAREDMMERLDALDLVHIEKVIQATEEEVQPHHQDETAFPPSGVTQQNDDDPTLMTPVERTRWRNRMYMRRKRAAATGTVASEDKRKLKPGRKTNAGSLLPNSTETAPPMGLGSQEATDADEPKHSRSDDGSGTHHIQSQRPTADQKIRKSLQDLGVDMAFIRENGLELFNLSNFGLLWSPAEDDSTVDSISYATLKMMRYLLDHFLHAVIHRAIVYAEEERGMKEHTRVFKDALNDLKEHHVTDALKLLGLDEYSRKARFLQQISAQSDTVGSDNYADAEEDEGVKKREELYPPIIYHETLMETLDVLVEGDVIVPDVDEEEKRIHMAEIAAEVY
ncbi:hypothetical protein FRC17_003582 [Serendipita sp. 399]|nr:hypothetical protein FRC17_003582 [Serendipita sp. 399]